MRRMLDVGGIVEVEVGRHKWEVTVATFGWSFPWEAPAVTKWRVRL